MSPAQTKVLEARIALRLEEVSALLIERARASGISETEISAYRGVLRAHLGHELERLLPSMIAFAVGGTSVAAPSRQQ